MNIEELKRQLLEQGITEEDLKKDKEKNKNKEKEIKEVAEQTETTKVKDTEENQKKYIEEVLDEKIAKTLNQNIRYVRNVLKMIEEGNTITLITSMFKKYI